MDTMGNLLAVIVHAANIHDTVVGVEPALFAFERYPSIKKFCADAGYRGTFVVDVDEILGIGVDISEKIKPHQWENSLGGGLLSVLLVGLTTLVGSAKIMRLLSILPKLSSKSLTCIL